MSAPAASNVAHDVIDTWRSDKPVVGLMGEFSAGKSTLLNFMLQAEAAPTKVTATPMPPTWFTFSDDAYTVGLTADGVEEPVDLSRDDIDFRASYLMIRKGMPSDVLKTCDIIDPPGISDPELRKDALRFLARYIDFVVWCTGASQAWRQTENAAYRKFAQTTKANSILVITRFDKLRSQKDRDKVLKRVRTEAGAFFLDVVALKTTKAAAVSLENRNDDETGDWVTTGGYGFEKTFAKALSETKPKRVKNEKKAAAPKPQSKKKKPAQKTPVNTGSSVDFAEAIEKLKTIPANCLDCSEIDHLIASIDCESLPKRTDNQSLRAIIRTDVNGLEFDRLLSQIEREVSAFEHGNSFRLDS